MTTNEYLKRILENETLKEESSEYEALVAEESKVSKLLIASFEAAKPLIKTGGSRAKGTMIKSNYDLDITCYFDREDSEAGDSIEEIFNNVKYALEKEYYVVPKTSSLRLEVRNPQSKGKYTHIDVVPGRFIDEGRKTDDVFLHQTEGKDRLKTNLQTHIHFIRVNKREETIRLLKIWKMRSGLGIKTFVLELMIVEILAGTKATDLESQLRIFWETIKDPQAQITVKDPANPEGNDLSEFLQQHRTMLSVLATQALDMINADNWKGVFGSAEPVSDSDKRSAVTSFAVANPTAPQPYSHECPAMV